MKKALLLSIPLVAIVFFCVVIAETDSGEQSEDEDTALAMYRPDEVHAARGHYIVDWRDLVPVAETVTNMHNGVRCPFFATGIADPQRTAVCGNCFLEEGEYCDDDGKCQDETADTMCSQDCRSCIQRPQFVDTCIQAWVIDAPPRLDCGNCIMDEGEECERGIPCADPAKTCNESSCRCDANAVPAGDEQPEQEPGGTQPEPGEQPGQEPGAQPQPAQPPGQQPASQQPAVQQPAAGQQTTDAGNKVEPVTVLKVNRCSSYVIGFRNERERKMVLAANEKAQQIMKVNDVALFAGREGTVAFVCETSLPAERATILGTTSTQKSGEVSTGAGAFELVQTSGAVLRDFRDPAQMQYYGRERLPQPVVIFPFNASAADISQLATAKGIGKAQAILNKAVPLRVLIPGIKSVPFGKGESVNGGMVEHQSTVIGPEEDYSLSSNNTVVISPLVLDQSNPIIYTKRVLDVTTVTLPTSCPSWTGVEGYGDCEQPVNDIDSLLEELKGVVKSGERVGADVATRLKSWSYIDSDNYMGVRNNQAQEFGVKQVGLEDTGLGGGCACSYSMSALDGIKSAIPSILVLLFAMSGGIVARVKKNGAKFPSFVRRGKGR